MRVIRLTTNERDIRVIEDDNSGDDEGVRVGSNAPSG